MLGTIRGPFVEVFFRKSLDWVKIVHRVRLSVRLKKNLCYFISDGPIILVDVKRGNFELDRWIRIFVIVKQRNTDQARVGEPLLLADAPPGHQHGHLGDEEAAGGQQDDVPAPCLAAPQQVQAVDGPPDDHGHGGKEVGHPDKPFYLPHG